MTYAIDLFHSPPPWVSPFLPVSILRLEEIEFKSLRNLPYIVASRL